MLARRRGRAPTSGPSTPTPRPSTALRDTLAATVTALGGAGDVLPTRAGWARVTLHEYHRTIGRERDRFRLEVRFARPRRAWRLLPGAEQSAADGTLTVAQSAPDGPVHYFARTMQYALLRLAVAEEARPSPEDARRAAADPSLILPGPTDPPRAAVLGPGVLPVYAVERASVPGRWRVRNRITWELLPGEGTSAAALTLARRLNAVARSPLGGGDP